MLFFNKKKITSLGELREAFISELSPILSDYTYLKSEDYFIKKTEYGLNYIQIIFTNFYDEYQVKVGVYVKHDKVNEIFYKFISLEKKWQRYHPTIGAGIGDILENKGVVFNHHDSEEYELIFLSEIPRTVKKVVKSLTILQNDFFILANDLKNVDRMINTHVFEVNKYCGIYLYRAIKGIIVSKLIDSPNFEKLYNDYRSHLVKHLPTKVYQLDDTYNFLNGS